MIAEQDIRGRILIPLISSRFAPDRTDYQVPQNIYDNEIFFQGYKRLRDTGAGLNDCLEQPAFRKLVPNIKGKILVDLGCGMGHLASWCVSQGAAKVTGIDISEKMLGSARERHSSEKIEYRRGSLEEFAFPAESVDVILSSLAFHYTADYNGLLKRIFSALKPGGYLLASMEHPVMTCSHFAAGWNQDEQGNNLNWRMDDYQHEGLRKGHWYVDNVERYHRTISTLINGLINNGFVVEHVSEPEAIPEAITTRPDLTDHSRRPPFLILKAKKP